MKPRARRAKPAADRGGAGAPSRQRARRADGAQAAVPAAGVELLRIGSRVRHGRLVRGLKLRELAEKVDCSESLLSKIENDKVQPSLRMLHRILAQLDTSIGALFTQSGDDERVVMRAGERQIIPTGANSLRKNSGVKLEWLVPYPESRLLSGSIHIVAPGGGSDGCIAHEGEEVAYVLEGEIELTVNEKTYLLHPGDSFFFPSDLPHGYRNPGDREARIIWINTPPTF
jgi:quercetin dioxygenase-like cupin family protein/DNA-binding XRE family transcriptional regulator